MPRRSQEAEDEAFAKALQDEYRQEFIRRQAEQNNVDLEGDTADSEQRKKRSKKKSKKKKGSKHRNDRSRSSSRDSTTERRRRRRQRGNSDDEYQQESMGYGVIPLPPPPFVHDRDASGNNTSGDEEYARRMQQEIADAEYAQRLSENRTSNQYSGYANSRAAPVAYPVPQPARKDSSISRSSGSTGPLTDDDEMVARRIQQEIADAEYAERIINLEREEAASRGYILSIERQNQLEMAQRQQQQPRPKSCLATWLPMLLCIAVAVTIPLLYVFDIFNPADLLDLIKDDWVGGSLNNMTFDDINGTLVPQLPSDAIGWGSNGIGLRLDILNACTDEYHPFVQEALDDWENGFPIDSLTLSRSRIVDPDPEECDIVNGKLKICNYDYGDTQWRGINEVQLSGLGQRRIIGSRAKLNEYYLNRESDAQKLYTSCHELGHGFGLPHWDENFYNRDLGNCMDYTQNPQKSSKPDASNFLYLAQLYGGINTETNEEMTAEEAIRFVQSYNEASGQSSANNSNDKKTNDKKNGGLNLGSRYLAGSDRSLRHGRTLSSIPLSESRVVPVDLSGGQTLERRILHADEHSEIHVFDSVDQPGDIIVQQYLLVKPEE